MLFDQFNSHITRDEMIVFLSYKAHVASNSWNGGFLEQ